MLIYCGNQHLISKGNKHLKIIERRKCLRLATCKVEAFICKKIHHKFLEMNDNIVNTEKVRSIPRKI